MSLGGFFSPSAYYNVMMLIIGIVQIMIGVFGFIIAIKQINKVKSSAEAASKASEDTRERLAEVTSLVSLADLCRLSDNLLSLLHKPQAKAAMVRAQDLRNALARAEPVRIAAGILEPEWQELIMKVSSVFEALSSSDPAEVSFAQCRSLVGQVAEKLNAIVSKLEANIGDH